MAYDACVVDRAMQRPMTRNELTNFIYVTMTQKNYSYSSHESKHV